jgi:phage regulator Rha-like protein
MDELIPIERIEKKILLLRSQKVMIDADLAALYGVSTKVLIQSVKRNTQRFPPEFMFRLSNEEYQFLRSQIVTSKKGRGGRRHLPYAFTEHGVAMLATVLNSDQAVRMSILIIKVFVRLRELLSSHKELAEKLQLLDTRIDKHDQEIQAIIEAIRQLMLPPEKPKRQIRSKVEEPSAKIYIKEEKR